MVRRTLGEEVFSGWKYDLALVERWRREGSPLVAAGAMPGLSLIRTAAHGQPRAWGVRFLHPDGRELFLRAPAVAELEANSLAYPATAYPMMQAREALMDRAGALDADSLLPHLARQMGIPVVTSDVGSTRHAAAATGSHVARDGWVLGIVCVDASRRLESWQRPALGSSGRCAKATDLWAPGVVGQGDALWCSGAAIVGLGW